MTERKKIEIPTGYCRLNKCECPSMHKRACGPNVDYTACPQFAKLGVKYAYQTTDADGSRRIHLEASKSAESASKETRQSSGDRLGQKLFSDIAPDKKVRLPKMS